MLEEYDNFVQYTAVYPKAEGGIYYAALGLTGEAGEVANQVKKILRDDGGKITTERRLKLIDELGDVAWYLSAVAQEIGSTFQEVLDNNIDKLYARKENDTIHGR